MIIGIHAHAAFTHPKTGVEEYARRIISRILALPDAAAHRFLLYTKNKVGDPVFSGLHVTLETLHFPFAWTQLRLSWQMLRYPPDTLFVPAHALPRILPKRTVVTIHGVEFEHVPQFYPRRQREYLRFVTHDAVRRASHVIAISEATKKDLVGRYRVSEEKITVVHHGAPPLAEAQHPSSGPPYFLFVGRVALHKNVDGLIRAFTLFKAYTKFPHRLVLAGAPGFGYGKIAEAIEKSSARDAIVLAGYVTDPVRTGFLSGASALVLPSWAEGFGLPILEAQAAGTPVVCSSVTAMPEVAGDAALLVPPGIDEALADALTRAATDTTLAETLIAKGRENVRRFSWERAAQETLRILTAI